MLSINAASAALMISGIPFEGPIGSVRIAYSTDGEWVPAPDVRRVRRLACSSSSSPGVSSKTATSPS